MSKYIDESIIVHVDKGATYPAAFIWRRRLYRVSEIVSWWHEPSAWWDGEPVRVLVRLTAGCKGASIFELCQRDSSWFLHRLLD